MWGAEEEVAGGEGSEEEGRRRRGTREPSLTLLSATLHSPVSFRANWLNWLGVLTSWTSPTYTATTSCLRCLRCGGRHWNRELLSLASAAVWARSWVCFLEHLKHWTCISLQATWLSCATWKPGMEQGHLWGAQGDENKLGIIKRTLDGGIESKWLLWMDADAFIADAAIRFPFQHVPPDNDLLIWVADSDLEKIHNGDATGTPLITLKMPRSGLRQMDARIAPLTGSCVPFEGPCVLAMQLSMTAACCCGTASGRSSSLRTPLVCWRMRPSPTRCLRAPNPPTGHIPASSCAAISGWSCVRGEQLCRGLFMSLFLVLNVRLFFWSRSRRSSRCLTRKTTPTTRAMRWPT